MDTILWPLKVAVAWVMVYIHKFLVLIGLSDGPGVAWVLSIIGLTIFVRILIMPLFVRPAGECSSCSPSSRRFRRSTKGRRMPLRSSANRRR